MDENKLAVLCRDPKARLSTEDDGCYFVQAYGRAWFGDTPEQAWRKAAIYGTASTRIEPVIAEHTIRMVLQRYPDAQAYYVHGNGAHKVWRIALDADYKVPAASGIPIAGCTTALWAWEEAAIAVASLRDCETQVTKDVFWIKADEKMQGIETKDPWQHRAENMRCKTCMWFAPKKDDIGRCRRHAPTMNGYPVVMVTDWCGDHKLNEVK